MYRASSTAVNFGFVLLLLSKLLIRSFSVGDGDSSRDVRDESRRSTESPSISVFFFVSLITVSQLAFYFFLFAFSSRITRRKMKFSETQFFTINFNKISFACTLKTFHFSLRFLFLWVCMFAMS